MSVPPTSSVGSADSSAASEPECSSDSESAWEDDPEAPPSLVDVPPLHAARENTSVMDSKNDNSFFKLTIPFLLLGELFAA